MTSITEGFEGNSFEGGRQPSLSHLWPAPKPLPNESTINIPAFESALSFFNKQCWNDAESVCRAILAQYPLHADALHLLGVIAMKRNSLTLAVGFISAAIRIHPTSQMHYNLAIACKDSDDYQNAYLHYLSAIDKNPNFVDALTNLGALLHEMGKPNEAIDCYQKALKINNNDANARSNLALSYYKLGQIKLAQEQAQIALTLDKTHYGAMVNSGLIQQELGHFDKAEQLFAQAITVNPKKSTAYAERGLAFQEQGLFDEAIENLCEALLLQPNSYATHSNLLFTLSIHPDCDPAQYLEQAKQYNQILSSSFHAYSSWPHTHNHRPGETKLRIGLVSGDLKEHPVGYFLESMICKQTQSNFDWVAYPTQAAQDTLTQRIKPYFTAWTPIAELSDAEAAQKIHADGIDILIDLSGHTAHNRLPVFAQKPSPLQVSWLGYWASTGLDAIDYLIADEVSLPANNQSQFSEKIAYLPQTRLCFTAPDAHVSGAVSTLPALRNKHLTFGCFQPLRKITEQTLNLWAAILNANPNATMRFQNKQLSTEHNKNTFLKRIADAGISPSRVSVFSWTSRADYFQAHGEVDFILDTFPCSGGTTTCEALWMGVPTLTLAGNTMISRQGASLLSCVGLQDWVATSHDEYLQKANMFSAAPEQLSALRGNLRETMLASPLLNAERFAQNFEQTMLDLWRQKQASC
jgi:protein O-GlcNAc transferase